MSTRERRKTELRQRLLFLYTFDADPSTGVCAWAELDGTGRTEHETGDDPEPPYPSVLAALRDGWRVIQVPVYIPPYPGTEHDTGMLRFEFVLEKLEQV